MIKLGTYKFPSTNQRTFVYEVNPPDYIKTWFEEPNGEPQDHWWDMDITPQKFHWLVNEWNNGNIAKTYPHWWELEKEDGAKEHINSLLQLNHVQLQEVLNYAAYVWPHYRWTTELQFESNIRPLMCNGRIMKFVDIPKDEAIAHNKKEKSEKKYRADMLLYGKSDLEYIKEKLED